MRSYMTVVIALAFVVVACSDSSDSNGDVTIEVTLNDDFDTGNFTATGSAICDSGTTATLDWDVDETQWWHENQFTCTDGSGTFVLRGELPPPPEEPSSLDGTWTILAGDGDYLGVEASGTVKTAPPEIGTVSYVGEMSLSDS
jgi:hypothetical protein